MSCRDAPAASSDWRYLTSAPTVKYAGLHRPLFPVLLPRPARVEVRLRDRLAPVPARSENRLDQLLVAGGQAADQDRDPVALLGGEGALGRPPIVSRRRRGDVHAALEPGARLRQPSGHFRLHDGVLADGDAVRPLRRSEGREGACRSVGHRAIFRSSSVALMGTQPYYSLFDRRRTCPDRAGTPAGRWEAVAHLCQNRRTSSRREHCGVLPVHLHDEGPEQGPSSG